jgi:histidinol-phosphate aminotransferase
MNIVRSSVEKLGAYVVAQDLDLVKLNQNEAPDDVPADVKERVIERLRRTGWNRYPQGGPAELEDRISAATGFPMGGILAGNGSNELIQAVLLAACAPGDRVVTVRPGFAVYRRVAGLLSLSVDEVALGGGFRFDVDGLIAKSKGAGAVVIASPNNPTGTAFSTGDAERLVRSFEGLVVIDEAYFEFHGRSVQNLVAEHPNLVVLRTLSKAWRLAGARLGYLLGDAAVVRGIAKAKLPFSVGFFARIAGEVLLESEAAVKAAVLRIVAERGRVFETLRAIPGIDPVPSTANFILFRTGAVTAAEFFERLRKRGVLVRPFDDPALRHHLRVTIGTRRENDIFLEAVLGAAGGDADEAGL